MATGKNDYIAKTNNGNLINVDAMIYKEYLRRDFGVDSNRVPTRIAGAMWGPKAEIYDQLASTVTAIERGQASNWDLSNLISGMNNASLNVRKASIELLEVCREELVKLEAEEASEIAKIQKDNSLYAAGKKDKIKARKDDIKNQKKYIFGVLEDIRNANARERTFQWANDFLSSLSKKFVGALNKKNLALAIMGLIICVAVKSLAAAGILGFLGVVAPYALPFVVAGVCLFAFCKLVKGVYNAWQDANQQAVTAKTDAGDRILSRAAKLKEKDLSTLREAMEDAQAEVNKVQLSIDKKSKELEAKINELRNSLQEKLNSLQTKRGKASTTEKKFLESQLKEVEISPDVVAIKQKIDTLKNELESKKTDLTDKTEQYKLAEQAAVESRARANKVPDPAVAKQQSLKERLQDSPTSSSASTPKRRI